MYLRGQGEMISERKGRSKEEKEGKWEQGKKGRKDKRLHDC